MDTWGHTPNIYRHIPQFVVVLNFVQLPLLLKDPLLILPPHTKACWYNVVCYISFSFQNPSDVTLASRGSRQLVGLVAEHICVDDSQKYLVIKIMHFNYGAPLDLKKTISVNQKIMISTKFSQTLKIQFWFQAGLFRIGFESCPLPTHPTYETLN